MRQFAVQVVQIATSSGLLHVQCRGAVPGFDPGQAGLALSQGASQPFLRVPVYPFHVRPEGFEFCVEHAPDLEQAGPVHPFAALAPGDTLSVLGPCGHGFDLAERPGHLVLVAGSPARLFSLIDEAIGHGWAATLLMPPDAPRPAVPDQLELHRGALTAELAEWADLIILDCPASGGLVEEIRRLCPGRRRGFIQALVDIPMPCGTGACQACWVESHPRRRLACVDGPVLRY